MADCWKYHAPSTGDPFTLTLVALANVCASAMSDDRYAMIGMPTPHLEPSPCSSRTCTGLPLPFGSPSVGVTVGVGPPPFGPLVAGLPSVQVGLLQAARMAALAAPSPARPSTLRREIPMHPISR